MNLSSAVAAASSLCYGSSQNFVRAGLSRYSPLMAAVLVSVVASASLWVVAGLFLPMGLFLTPGIWIFILDGLLTPGTARIMMYYGISKVGVSRTSSIAGSNPMFALLLAMAFLNERLTIPLLVGTLGVVGGIVLLSYREEGSRWRTRDLLFPVASAVLFGIAPIIRKWGLGFVPVPLVATTVGTTSSMVASFLFMILSGNSMRINSHGLSLCYLALGGITGSAGELAYNLALSQGKVSTVAPIANTFPLITMMLAVALQKERITRRLISGTLLIVSGAVFILVF